MDYIYKIHRIQTLDKILLPFLAGKFAALRLSALAISSTAFSSTFEVESAFTAVQWIERLERPSTHYFIAVAYPANTPAEFQTIDTGSVAKLLYLNPYCEGYLS